MNSVNLIKSIRHYLAADASLRTLLGASSAADALSNRLFYKDSIYASKNVSGASEYLYPHIGLKLNDDNPILRGADDNCVYVELIIENKIGNTNAQLVNIQIKDSIKELLEEKSKELNTMALTLSPPVILKVRDIAWVSAITYDDKEQGSERRHRFICAVKLIVGD